MRPRHCLLLSVVVVLAACSGEQAAPTTTRAVIPNTAPSTLERPTTTAAGATNPTTVPSTTPTVAVTTGATAPPTTPAPPAPEVAAAIAVWDQWWAAITDPAVTPDQLAALADPAAIETVTRFGVSYWQGPPFSRSPFVTATGDGITIDDCVVGGGPIVIPELNTEERPESTHFTGTLTDTAAGLRITSFTASRFCVPAPIATAALAAWNNYNNVLAEVFNARTPGDPRLPQIASSDHLERLTSLLQRGLDENFEIRGLPSLERAPVVIAYLSPTAVRIADCHTQSLSYGAFDLSSGERREDLIVTPDEGLNGLDEATLLLLDGVWKVDSRASSTNSECSAPVSGAVSIVGGQ
jgi:hypothetical protein